MVKWLTKKLTAYILLILLVGLVLVDYALYKSWVVKESAKNRAAVATKQAEIDLLASEVDWLANIPESATKSDKIRLRSVAETMMFFARDLKKEQANFAVTISKVAVTGEASNSIVELSTRLITIDGQSYIPIDLFGTYIVLDDFKRFIEDFTLRGVAVRKLKIAEGNTFELSILMPVSLSQP
jgi:hypothetical protein